MKVTGIGGSPRRDGNSEMLLDAALEGARSRGASIEKIVLNELTIRPCQECGGCDLTGRCVIEDDMARVYRAMAEADAVIVASPIFFGTVTAQLKAMIDRFQCVWVDRNILKKYSSQRKRKGAFICVCASGRTDFFNYAIKVVRMFFATVGLEYTSELLFHSVDDKGSIRDRAGALGEAFRLGVEIVVS